MLVSPYSDCSEELFGNADNNTFRPNDGENYIDGRNGVDTVIYDKQVNA